jgi:hypothetical protein
LWALKIRKLTASAPREMAAAASAGGDSEAGDRAAPAAASPEHKTRDETDGVIIVTLHAG